MKFGIILKESYATINLRNDIEIIVVAEAFLNMV